MEVNEYDSVMYKLFARQGMKGNPMYRGYQMVPSVIAATHDFVRQQPNLQLETNSSWEHTVCLYDSYLEYLAGGNLDAEVLQVQQVDVFNGDTIDYQHLLYLLYSGYRNTVTAGDLV